jgi:hypothetical protein
MERDDEFGTAVFLTPSSTINVTLFDKERGGLLKASSWDWDCHGRARRRRVPSGHFAAASACGDSVEFTMHSYTLYVYNFAHDNSSMGRCPTPGLASLPGFFIGNVHGEKQCDLRGGDFCNWPQRPQ